MTPPVAPVDVHSTLVLLLEIALLLLAAVALGQLAARVGMPAIVGELGAGVLLGPSVLGHALPGFSEWLLPHNAAQFHMLDAVASMGALLLVAMIGMELDYGLVRRRGLTAGWISMGGFFLPLVLGVATGLLLPASLLGGTDRKLVAFFLGVALCVSALPVIAKTLLDMNLLHRNVGQLTLAAGVVDDVLGWLLLSVVAAMATTGVRAHTVARSVAYVVLLILAAALVARPVAIRTLAWTQRKESPALTIGVVVVMVWLAAAATQAMALEAVFGAFVAGVVVGSSRGFDRSRLAPLRTVVMAVLAPLFFATAGLRMDLTALGRPAVLVASIALVVVAVVGKFTGVFAASLAARLNRWEALAVGAGMNARGAVQMIIAMVGLRLHVLNTETYTMVMLVAIVTSLMAPPILRWSMRHVEHTAEERLRENTWKPAAARAEEGTS